MFYLTKKTFHRSFFYLCFVDLFLICCYYTCVINSKGAQIMEHKEHLNKSKEEIKKAVDIIFRELNVMNHEDLLGDILSQELSIQHRTIQQAFIGQFKRVVEKHAESPTDPRNQASVDWAKLVKDCGKKIVFPYL